MNFEGIFNQIFQPYFYYSLIFPVISFLCIKVLGRVCNFMGPKTRSLLYLVPLAAPLVVMLIFMPSTIIQTTSTQIKAVTISAGGPINGFFFSPFMPSRLQPGMFISAGQAPTALILTVTQTITTSVTGIICIIGLAAGAFFASSMILADDRIARRVLHVILLSPDEHGWLQTKILDACKNLAIASPKVGVVEDLRPNAFTIGYGRRATIVFSIGLLNALDKEELAAVAYHELGHVKNRDFFYKTLASALTIVSFFNPIAYIASSNVQREREMLADQRAIELLESPTVFGNALAKICRAIQNLPKESLLVSFSSNLIVTSSVLHGLSILSTHPRLDKRLRNISGPKATYHLNRRNVILFSVVILFLVLSSTAVSYAMVNLQNGFTSSQQVKAPSMNLVGAYAIVGPTGLSSFDSVTIPFGLPQNMNAPVYQTCRPIIVRGLLFTNNESSFIPPQDPAYGSTLLLAQNVRFR